MVPVVTSFPKTSRLTGWPLLNIAVAPRSKSRKQRLEEFLREKRLLSISEEHWSELITLLEPISESYLRDLLQATGIPIAQPFGGVRQTSLEDLEASLVEMEKEYSKAVANHDDERATACRRTVIQAKDRARLVSRNQKVDSEKRRQKAEMVEWMLVWLENPGIFESWVGLRKNAVTCRSEPD
jgi:hypothetical protein